MDFQDYLASIDPEKLSKSELVALYQATEELSKRESQNKIDTFYPETGPLRRELYKKHLEFFRAGREYSERAIIAANRIGKSVGIGGYEVSLHLTGEYPDWWEGRVFNHPTDWWAAGDTGKTARDTIQLALLGPFGSFGTGMIRGSLLLGTTPKHGLPEAVETIRVKHKSGGVSTCTIKSYDQRRESFQGTAKHGVWLDEEPPQDVYSECLLRTLTTGGILLCTFTPLMGVSEVVKSFMPGLGENVGEGYVH